MLEFILISIMVLIWVCFGQSVTGLRVFHIRRSRPSGPAGEERFRCEVQLSAEPTAEGLVDAFIVKVKGLVVVPSDMHDTDIQVLLADVTDGGGRASAVLETSGKWQMEDSPAFCYRAHNGKIPRRRLILSEWITVATIRTNCLKFPRSGVRKLQFITSLISRESGAELVCAADVIGYRNTQPGYVDAKENSDQTRVLCVQLAAAVWPADTQTDEAGPDIILQRIERQCSASQRGEDHAEGLGLPEDVLREAAGFCRSGVEIDIESVCRDMTATSAITERYNVIELCLRVAGGGDSLGVGQIEVLTRIAELLDIDSEKFRSLAQKLLPIDEGQAEHVEFILGITSEMTIDQRRQLLNDEYRKWNARVTHQDAAIAAQADRMLTLIAEAGSSFARQQCAGK